jgi:phosphate transport system protein
MTFYETRLSRDSEALRSEVVALSADVQQALSDSIRAVLRSDRNLAYRTIIGDHPINRAAEHIEASAHRFIAKHLPSAGHLRFVSSVMRIAVLLERLGDYAVTICRESVRLQHPLTGTFRKEVEAMAADTMQMYEQAIRAFESGDESLARGTMGYAKQVDRDFAIAFSLLVDKAETSVEAEELFGRLVIITQLERVSDQAKNLCEETVFAITGETKKRRPMRLLFVDQTDDGLTQMATAITNEQCVGRAIAASGGSDPASHVDPRVVSFLESHGYDASVLHPSSLSALDEPMDAFDVVISLGETYTRLLPDLPFHTVAFDWEVPPISGDSSDSYRELATRISDLVGTLRGPVSG